MQSLRIHQKITVECFYGQVTSVSTSLRMIERKETDAVLSFVAKFPQKLVDVLKQHEAELVEESISFDYDYWTSGMLNR